MDSIVTKHKECYICGTSYSLEEHHLISGTSNRAQSEKYGLKLWLCHEHHRQAHEDRSSELFLKRLGQIYFEKTHSREEFIKTFGKSFILDEEDSNDRV